MEVLGGPEAETLLRELVDEDWRARGVEAATGIGEVFAYALLRGDTGDAFESIEYDWREHGDAIRGEDDEQPWNAAAPLSGAEARIEVCLALARYVERRVPFVDLSGGVRRTKAAMGAGDESGWTPVSEGPVLRYVRALREDGAERTIPPDLRLRTLNTVELACTPSRSVMLVEEGLRGRLEDVASSATATPAARSSLPPTRASRTGRSCSPAMQCSLPLSSTGSCTTAMCSTSRGAVTVSETSSRPSA